MKGNVPEIIPMKQYMKIMKIAVFLATKQKIKTSYVGNHIRNKIWELFKVNVINICHKKMCHY